MTTLASSALAEYCRGALQLGLGALLQSTLLITLGLLVATVLHRRGPVLGVFVYKTTLASVIAATLISVCCASRLTSLWQVSLPASLTDGSENATAGRFQQPFIPSLGAAEEPASPAHAGVGDARPAVAMPASPASLADQHRRIVAYRNARAEAESARRRRGGLYVAMAALWALGAGLLLGWLASVQLYLMGLRARSVPVETGPAAELLQALCTARNIEQPRLLASDRVPSPFLTGLRRPAILLPAAYATEFDAPTLRAILAHEIAHLAQRDCAWNLLGHVACGVGWVQPLLWLLRRRMEQASEVLCDQAVIQEHCSPREYARCLVDLAERFLPGTRERAFRVGMVPERSSLGRRVQQIIVGPRSGARGLSRRQRAAVATGALAAVVSGVFLISVAGPATNGTGRLLALASAAPVGAGTADALTKPHGPLAGSVMTPDGKPVPAAQVFWISREDREVEIRSTVTTDAAGRFRFADADGLRAQGTQPRLLILADGWGATFWDLLHETGEPAIPLAPATTLRVPFLGSDGQPVAGLAVRPRLLVLELHSFAQFPAQLEQRFATQTDERGIATFSGLPQGARLQLQTSDARFAQLGMEDERNLAVTPVTEAKPIWLKPAASIHGRIRYGATGKPAAGIRVGAQGTDLDRGYGDAVTDAEGKYHMTQLPAGSYNVALDLKGELAQSWTARAHERLVVTDGEHPESVDFTLIPGAVVTGKLLAADNGAPLAGIRVSIYGPAHPRSSAWVQGMPTEADGSYFFRVPPGPQYLYVSSAVPPGFLASAKQSHDLMVQDGTTTTVDFRFPRADKPPRLVQGRIVGPDGAPVAGAEVVVQSSDHRGFRDTVRRSGADGAFALEADLVAEPVTLRARQGGMGTEKGIVATAGDRVTLRLKQDVLVTLTGMVTDRAAHSLVGAEVDLLEFSSGRPTIGRPIRRTTTDAQGQFTLTGLWPDRRYSVIATAAGHGQQRSALLEDLQAGATRALEPLVLPQADRFVAGHVVDEAGKPLAGISVSIGGPETPPRFQTTDRQGRFRFAGVVEEEVTLQVKEDGDRWQRQRVPAGTPDAVLVLSRSAK